MTTRPDPAVARMLRPDGTVVVPPQLAAEVLRTLVVGATAQARADGGVLGPGARTLLHALYEAANTSRSSVPGTPEPQPAKVEVTAQQAAQVMGCSTEYMRRLARSGRVRARRAGPAWLIDTASLDAYRTGGTPCTRSTSPP